MKDIMIGTPADTKSTVSEKKKYLLFLKNNLNNFPCTYFT